MSASESTDSIVARAALGVPACSSVRWYGPLALWNR